MPFLGILGILARILTEILVSFGHFSRKVGKYRQKRLFQRFSAFLGRFPLKTPIFGVLGRWRGWFYINPSRRGPVAPPGPRESGEPPRGGRTSPQRGW